MKRRTALAALFAAVLVPGLVGLPMVLVGVFDHLLWMKMVGTALVLTVPLRNLVLFPLIRRRHDRRQRPSEAREGPND